MQNVIVITHKDCFDGIASAWVLRQKYPKATFIQQAYEEEPQLVQLVKADPDAYVIIADFSYPIDVLINAAWVQRSGAILVMDHHAPFIRQVQEYRVQEDNNEVSPIPSHVEFILDNDRSGAAITWDFCNPGVEYPMVIKAVQDHDLHRHEYPFTADVVQAIGFYGLDIDAVEITSKLDVGTLASMGSILRKKQTNMVEWHLANTTRTVKIEQGTISVTNAPRYVASDVINRCVVDALFGIAYYYQANGLKLSFRSDANGMDVSELAALFGGSGHKHAAGAVLPLKWTIDDVVNRVARHLYGKKRVQ